MSKEDYGKYYIQGFDHYLIPKDIFDELFEEMESWKHDTQKYKEVIDKSIELNKQVIKDTKEFYRPTKDIIYSGDTLIDIAEQNLNILKEVE